MAWNLEETLAYYKRIGAPSDQSALISLLKEVQQENGGIPVWIPGKIADFYGIKAGILLALIRRIPNLRLLDGHLLELCAGPNCSRHTALASAAEKLADKGITVTYIPCMRMCGKGPNIRLNGKVYHGVDTARLQQLLDELQQR